MKIINFKASNFQGDCFVDEEFGSKCLIPMNALAVKHNMMVIITSSGRKDTNVKGAIVTPAKMSNHLIYHAIDFNLKNVVTGEYYNSKKMGDGTGTDELFLEDVDRNTDLRWGQAFKTPDSVHMDDAMNIKNPVRWHELYIEIQQTKQTA